MKKRFDHPHNRLMVTVSQPERCPRCGFMIEKGQKKIFNGEHYVCAVCAILFGKHPSWVRLETLFSEESLTASQSQASPFWV